MARPTSPPPLGAAGVSWGPDVVAYHPADARLAALPQMGFDPWAGAGAAQEMASSTATLPAAAATAAAAQDTAQARGICGLPVGGFDPWAGAAATGGDGEREATARSVVAELRSEPPRQRQQQQQLQARPQEETTEAAARLRRRSVERLFTAPSKREELRRVVARAERLGLTGPIGEGDAGAGEDESAVATALRCGARDRARETWDSSRMDTALTWFEEFAADSRREPLFKPLSSLGDVVALTYNQTTLDMFGEYLRRRGSRLRGSRGKTLLANTIGSYVSTIKTLRVAEAHHQITDARVNTVGPAAAKRMRQQDGPPGDRALKRGVRAEHLGDAAARGFDRSSKQGKIRWSAATLAHNLCLRGGEIGVVDGAEFNPARDLKIGDIEFLAPSAESHFKPWLFCYVVAIKDTYAQHRVVPMPVQRLSAGGTLGGDCMDVYDALALAIEARTGRLPPSVGRVEGPDAQLPLFVRRRGGAWRTQETRELAQEIATLLGMDPGEFGAKSFRIGGATDWRAVFGPAGAEALIRERGRWCSTVAKVYQRALAEEHLRGSAAVSRVRGSRELEALAQGWAQPASFR